MMLKNLLLYERNKILREFYIKKYVYGWLYVVRYIYVFSRLVYVWKDLHEKKRGRNEPRERKRKSEVVAKRSLLGTLSTPTSDGLKGGKVGWDVSGCTCICIPLQSQGKCFAVVYSVQKDTERKEWVIMKDP